MGATGNREYTVFSTGYWTLRIFMIIMFESLSLPPNCIMYSITRRVILPIPGFFSEWFISVVGRCKDAMETYVFLKFLYFSMFTS